MATIGRETKRIRRAGQGGGVEPVALPASRHEICLRGSDNPSLGIGAPITRVSGVRELAGEKRAVRGTLLRRVTSIGFTGDYLCEE